MSEIIHKSVLPKETLSWLSPKPNEVFVDATLGLGGHSEAILKAGENIKVYGLDQDFEAIEKARLRLQGFGEKFTAYHTNFAEIKKTLEENKVAEVDGILADLGVSSWQMDSPQRGFSFRYDAPLDMRMNSVADIPTAAELLNELSEFEIAKIIYEYGEERFSRRIARRIVEQRENGNPPETTGELVKLIEKSVPRKKNERIHPATRTFQALRIAVNRELEILEDFIRDSVDLLKTGGRLVVISFHSLEDRIVKKTLQKLAGKCECPPRLPRCVCGAQRIVEVLTRKPIIPNETEIAENPRARSAKLRACLKL